MTERKLAVLLHADVVGSTTQLINAAKRLPNKEFIVATEPGIFYKMKQASPHKTFLEAPTGGAGGSCESCLRCPWMAMNGLRNLAQAAWVVTRAAWHNRQSRGAHFREDARSDDFASLHDQEPLEEPWV